MILGIGTDIIKISRFNSWKNYSENQLSKIFTENEINDFFIDKKKLNLQSLATRFAAKEAFYKALSNLLIRLNLTENEFTFIFSCHGIEIVKSIWNVPQLKINWEYFENIIGKKLPELDVDLSISHEKSHALAFVILSLVK